MPVCSYRVEPVVLDLEEVVKLGEGKRLRTRAIGTLPYLLILLPVVVASLYVRQYGVNAPYNDGVTLIPLFEKLFAGELRFEDLAAQHNEHRIFFPRVALLLAGLATSFNDVATMYLIQVLLLLTTAMLLLIFRSTVSSNIWLFVPVPFLVFNLGQSWNMLQGFQLTLVFVQTFSVLTFLLLYLSDDTSDARRGWLAFCGALACGTVAAFSSAPGLLVWPLGLFQLLLLFTVSTQRRLKGTKVIMVGIWGLAGVLAWSLYLRGYESSETTSWRESLKNPLDSMEYLVSALGASLFHGRQDLAFICGLLLILLIAICLPLIFVNGGSKRSSFWLAALAFSLLTLAATTLARGSTLEDALNPKYVTYTVLVPIAIYAMLAGSLHRRRGLMNLSSFASFIHFGALGVLGILAAASLPLSYAQGITEAREIRENKERTAFVLATHESQPDEVLASRGVLRQRFRTDPNTSRDRINFLERRGYSVFSEPGRRVLPPPLPDSSQGFDNAPSGVEVDSAVQATLMRSPNNARESFVRVSGWTANPDSVETVKGVYVLVDGRPYPAFYGVRSREAAKQLKDPEYAYSGFERSIPVSEIGGGKHELSVVAMTDKGETHLGFGPLNNGTKRQLDFELSGRG